MRLALLLIPLLAACKCVDEPVRWDLEPQLSVHLRSVSVDHRGGMTLAVEFENTGDLALMVVEPQDGSVYGWTDPHFQVEVLPKQWQPVPRLSARCGNHGASYTPETMRRLDPGQSTTITVRASWGTLAAGNYQVRVRYKVRPGRFPKGGSFHAPSARDPQWIAWPEGVFVGEAASNAASLVVVRGT